MKIMKFSYPVFIVLSSSAITSAQLISWYKLDDDPQVTSVTNPNGDPPVFLRSTAPLTAAIGRDGSFENFFTDDFDFSGLVDIDGNAIGPIEDFRQEPSPGDQSIDGASARFLQTGQSGTPEQDNLHRANLGICGGSIGGLPEATASMWVSHAIDDDDAIFLSIGIFGSNAPLAFWRDATVSGQDGQTNVLRLIMGGTNVVSGPEALVTSNDGSTLWYHIAFTFQGANPGQDDGLVEIFIDGVSVGSAATSNETIPIAGLTPLAAGQTSDRTTDGAGRRPYLSGRGMNGLIDEITLYNAALSLAQIQQLAAGANPEVVAPVPPPAPPAPLLMIAQDASELEFSWLADEERVYDILSNVDLTLPPSKWVIYDDGVTIFNDIVAGEGMFTLSGVQMIGDQRFFVLREEDAPPPVLFFEDFEEDGGGFTTANKSLAFPLGSDWEFGAPNSDPNAAGGAVIGGANGSANAWGTVLGDGSSGSGFVASGTVACLRTPVIDLTAITSATLTFDEALDGNDGTVGNPGAVDLTEIFVIDANTDIVIGSGPFYSESDGDINNADWRPVGPRVLPSGAFTQPIRLEFRFTGNSDEFLGWYIDNVSISGQ